MNGRGRRNKGARGERELAELLFYRTGVEVTRNLDQVRNGGHDLDGIEGIKIEVKRQERLCLPAWWRQCIRQAKDEIPVLAYRQNYKPWTFVVGQDKVVMNKGEFFAWLEGHCATLANVG